MTFTRKEYCLRGHRRTPDTVAKGGECRSCRRVRQAAAVAAKRAAMTPEERADARRENDRLYRERHREQRRENDRARYQTPA